MTFNAIENTCDSEKYAKNSVVHENQGKMDWRRIGNGAFWRNQHSDLN